MYMTAQGGVRQDFLHVRAYNIMYTLTYTSDFNFVTPWICVLFYEIRKKNDIHFEQCIDLHYLCTVCGDVM